MRTQRYMWPLKLTQPACQLGDRACVKSIERLTHKDTLVLWQSASCLAAAATQASGFGVNADHTLGVDSEIASGRKAVQVPSVDLCQANATCVLLTREHHTEHLFVTGCIRESA